MKSKIVDNQPQEISNYLEIDPKEQDAIECVNEIFNTPYTLEIINRHDEKKLYTKLKLSQTNLQIENIYDYENDIKTGSATILFNKIKSFIDYKRNKSFFEFNFYDELNQPKFLYNAKFNFKPFFSNFEGTADEINFSYFFP